MVAKILPIDSREQHLAESVKICQAMGYPKRAARLLLETTGETVEDNFGRWLEMTLVFASRRGKYTRVFRSNDGRTWWLYYAYFTKREIYRP